MDWDLRLVAPWVALAGFFLGSFFDEAEIINQKPQTETIGKAQITQGDYMFSLLVLVTAVLKADGKILRSELDYVKEFLIRSFGIEGAKQALVILKDLTHQNIPVADICNQIRKYVDYSSRLQLVHFLFGIANADGLVHPDELSLIRQIATGLGVSEADYKSLEAMFVPKTDWAFDTVVMGEAQEFSQEHLLPTDIIINHRAMTKQEALDLCTKRNEVPEWTDETKIKNYFTPMKDKQ